MLSSVTKARCRSKANSTPSLLVRSSLQLKVFMYVEVSEGQMGTAAGPAQQKLQSWVRLCAAVV